MRLSCVALQTSEASQSLVARGSGIAVATENGDIQAVKEMRIFRQRAHKALANDQAVR